MHTRRRSLVLLLAGLLATGCALLPATVPPATISAPPLVGPTDIPVSPSPDLLPTPSPVQTPTATTIPVRVSTEPAAVSYTLPLVVQHVTETSATLFLEVDAPAPLSAVYWPADDPPQITVLALDPTLARHPFQIEDLTPGTRYKVVVGTLDDSLTLRQPYFAGASWGAVTFQTQGAAEALRVGVIGDSGFGEPITYRLASEMAGRDLDFAIHTGDLVYRMDLNADPYEAYRLKWYLPLAPTLQRMPVYPVVGNHDVEAAAQWNGQAFYYAAFPSFSDPLVGGSPFEGRNQWYAFAYGSIQFVMLDTQVFFNEPGRAEQDAWLAERLADERFSHTIVAFHVTAYTSGLHLNDGLAARQSWMPLFEAARVPLVLSGHDHNYERLQIGDLTYIVTGGGSTALYDQTTTLAESAIFVKQSHFVVLEIYPDRIELQAVAAGGEVIDQATIPLD